MVVQHDQPCPVKGKVDPGSIVYTTYRGKPARWLNGTVLVREDHLEQLNNETDQ